MNGGDDVGRGREASAGDDQRELRLRAGCGNSRRDHLPADAEVRVIGRCDRLIDRRSRQDRTILIDDREWDRRARSVSRAVIIGAGRVLVGREFVGSRRHLDEIDGPDHGRIVGEDAPPTQGLVGQIAKP